MLRIIGELPRCTQQLLVLLFGTFRAVSSSSAAQAAASTVPGVSVSGMTSEALGVSVAPSFFHSCIGAGRPATMDDVIRFKVNFTFNRWMHFPLTFS
jgi:Rho GTPase-activating protein 20